DVARHAAATAHQVNGGFLADLLERGARGDRRLFPATLLHVAKEVQLLVERLTVFEIVEERCGRGDALAEVGGQVGQAHVLEALAGLVEVGQRPWRQHGGPVSAGDDLHRRVARQVVEDGQRRGPGPVEARYRTVPGAHAEGGVEDKDGGDGLTLA